MNIQDAMLFIAGNFLVWWAFRNYYIYTIGRFDFLGFTIACFLIPVGSYMVYEAMY